MCVYLVLAKCAGADGVCYPSFGKIEQLTGFSRSTVSKCIKRLRDANLVNLKRAGNAASKQSNEYQLTSAPSELVRQTNQLELVRQAHRTSAPGAPGLVRQAHSKKTQLKRPIEKDRAKLIAIVDWWNHLAPSIGRASARTDPIAKSIQGAFAKVCKSAELKSYFADLAILEAAIRESTFLHGPEKGWFTLAKLLAGKNKSGEYIVEVINNGGYRASNSNGESKTGRSPVRNGAGVVYDPEHSGEF